MAALDGDQQAQVTNAIYLVNFVDFDPSNDEFITGIKKIYGLEELDSKELNKYFNDIILRVINYLYSGEWNLHNVNLGNSLTKKAFELFKIATLESRIKKKKKMIEEKKILKKINCDTLLRELKQEVKFLSFKTISLKKRVLDLHNKYIEQLNGKEINKILVYEAPPYPKENKEFNYIFFKNATGPYIGAIKNYFSHEDEDKEVAEILESETILFFDLLMLPIPINSNLRKMWLEEECFLIDSQPLPVKLFEMNFEYYTKIRKLTIEKPIFAIGTPHLTALPIFEYYSKNKLTEVQFESLRKTNNLDTRKIAELRQLVLPLFKACFVNASNNPDGTLLKLAFGKFD